MAHVYVRSGAGGAGTGADWANAYVTLNAALTAKAAGDQFWVATDHSETTAGTVTHTSPGTAAAPCSIYCVNHAGSVPPVSADLTTGAIVASTTSAAMVYAGYAICDGIDFRCIAGATLGHQVGTGSVATFWSFGPNTKMTITGSTSTAYNTFGTATTSIPSRMEFSGVMKFGAAGQGFRLHVVKFFWKGGSIDATGSIPTGLMKAANYGSVATFEGVDLSALGSGSTIIIGSNAVADIHIKDCKINAAVIVASTPASPAIAVYLTRTDSAGTNYRHEKYSYYGTQTVETTIVLTGGASDATTPIGWKLVTSANSKWLTPFAALPIAIWNETVGSAVTVTVQGIWGGGAVPNNDDIWMDVEYLGSSATPIGSFANGTKANLLATNAALAAGTGTWGGSTTKFKFVSTFTPQMKGLIYLYIKVAAASSTFYIDPKPVLS